MALNRNKLEECSEMLLLLGMMLYSLLQLCPPGDLWSCSVEPRQETAFVAALVEQLPRGLRFPQLHRFI